MDPLKCIGCWQRHGASAARSFEAPTRSYTERAITHALEDQHFDLTSFLWTVSWDDELAKRALVEGDATLTEFHYFDTLPEAEQVMHIEKYLDGIEG